MRAPFLLVVLTSLVALGSAGADEALPGPAAAVALVQPGGAWLIWTPGPSTPDYYVIYGGGGDHWLPLATAPADAFQASIVGEYPEYAVAAVTDGVESIPTVAATVTQGCITLQFTPPSVSVGCSDDAPNLGNKVRVDFSVNRPALL